MKSLRVTLSPTAKHQLTNLLDYLELNWSSKVQQQFIAKLDRSIDRISKYPLSCPESTIKRGIHWCVISKQTSLYYRVTSDEIEVIAIFDNRQDPEKLRELS